MQSNKINCCEKAIALYSFVICHCHAKRKFAAILIYSETDPIQILWNAGCGQILLWRYSVLPKLLKLFAFLLRYNYFMFYLDSFAFLCVPMKDDRQVCFSLCNIIISSFKEAQLSFKVLSNKNMLKRFTDIAM